MIDEQTLDNLIRRIYEQDLRAQAELFDLSYKYFYQLAVSKLKNKADAEDVVGTFFQNIYLISVNCVYSGNKMSYLKSCVVNLARNVIRERHRCKIKNLHSVLAVDEAKSTDFDSDINNLLDKQLTEQEKKVIIYMIYYDYSYREVAKIIGLSLGKVQRIKSSALNKIKKSYLTQ